MSKFTKIVLVIFFFSFIFTFSAFTFKNNVYAWSNNDLPIHKFNIGYTEPTDLGNLYSIAVDSSGNIYTADGLHSQIVKFNQAGDILLRFGKPGSGNGEFLNLFAITIDNDRNIYAVDNSGSNIQKFDNNGNFIWKIGSYGTANGQFKNPHDIAVDSTHSFYVAEYGKNGKIQKFDSNGTYLMTIDTGSDYDLAVSVDQHDNLFVSFYWTIFKYDSQGNFIKVIDKVYYSYVLGLGFDSSDNIYAAIGRNGNVLKMDSDGNLLETISSYGSNDNQLNWPYDVSLDNSGNIYVADEGNGYIKKFDNSGIFIKKYGTISTLNGQFNSPTGIAEDSKGNIYISDYYNNKVQKFDKNGNFLISFGTLGSGDGELNFPYYMAVDSNDNIYIADSNNNRIEVFDENGNYISQFGSYGTGDGEFDYPTSVKINKDGSIYVVDSYNSRIQVFNNNYEYVSQFGTEGSGDGQLEYPNSMALDNNGNIYVADSYNYRIEKFNSSGEYVSQFGSYGIDPEQFQYPIDLSIDSLNNIYVVDYYHHYIQKFDSNGILLSIFGDIGVGDYKFGSINGILTDNNNNLFITETSLTNDLKVYTYDKVAPTINSNSIQIHNLTGNITLTGTSVDNLSNITSVEYQLDSSSGSWTNCPSSDGNFNSLIENFTCSLSNISNGNHTVYLRSTDSFTNVSTSQFISDLNPSTPVITSIGSISSIANKDYLSYYFTSQTPYIKGTSDIGTTVYFVTNGHTYQATTDSLGEFSITLDNPILPRTKNTIIYYAKDISGSKSAERTLVLIVGEENFPMLSSSSELSTTSSIQSNNSSTDANNTVITINGDIVTIKVVDDNGNIVVNAKAIMNGITKYTDSLGMVTFDNIPTGKYVLGISYNGIEKSKTINVINSKSSTNSSAVSNLNEKNITSFINQLPLLPILLGIGFLVLLIGGIMLVYKKNGKRN